MTQSLEEVELNREEKPEKPILTTQEQAFFQKKTTEKSIEESQILDWYLDNFSVLLTEMDFV